MVRHLAIIFSLLCSILIGATSAEAERRLALLIGINDYSLADPSLRANLEGCLNDVALMESVLCDTFDFPRQNVRVLRNDEASESAIRAHLNAFAGEASDDLDAVNVPVLRRSMDPSFI